ncbi:hypothetical protein MRB53_001109 [Persea americana]|uniref:Uncharacterized protein n=1 Tax=Persea americana TaxID=3435 RepID=A0ACC2MQT2_PERAE|nr:hypothetical protein MRB53_001109 [Persea americana]
MKGEGKNSSRRSTTPPTNPQEENDLTQDPMDLIWYVRTVGLDESVINSISKCKYKRDEGLVEGTACSVCLNEFREDENLRLLPKCRHAFHLPCIDTWLRSHVSCPLCRANVVSNPSSSPLTDQCSISSDSVDESWMENSRTPIQVGGNQSEVVVGSQSFAHDNVSELNLSSRHMNCGFRALSDLIDTCRSRGCSIEMMEDEIQRVRSSISMDSLSSAMIGTSLANLPSIDSEGSSPASGVYSKGSKISNFGESSSQKRTFLKHGWSQSISKMLSNGSKGTSLQKAKLCYNRNTLTMPSAPTNTTTHQDHIRCNVGSSGLQESFINSITVCKYKRGEGLIEGTECSICLSEFHEDENLRLLPNCIHAFHLPCIDTWLKSNVNCPLCRMNVISNQMSSSSSSSLSFGSSDETQNHIGLGINGGNGVGENHSHTHVDVSALEASSSPRVDCGLRPQSDLGAVEMMNADIQLVRITVSMDSAAASVISEEAPQLTELVQSKENRSQASLDSDNKQNNGSLF